MRSPILRFFRHRERQGKAPSSQQLLQGPGDLGTDGIHPEPHALIDLGDTFSRVSPKCKPHPDTRCPPLSPTGPPSPYFPRGSTASTISESGTPSLSAMLATSSLMAPSWGTQPMWSSQRYMPPSPCPPGLSSPRLFLLTDFSYFNVIIIRRAANELPLILS